MDTPETPLASPIFSEDGTPMMTLNTGEVIGLEEVRVLRRNLDNWVHEHFGREPTTQAEVKSRKNAIATQERAFLTDYTLMIDTFTAFGVWGVPNLPRDEYIALGRRWKRGHTLPVHRDIDTQETDTQTCAQVESSKQGEFYNVELAHDFSSWACPCPDSEPLTDDQATQAPYGLCKHVLALAIKQIQLQENEHDSHSESGNDSRHVGNRHRNQRRHVRPSGDSGQVGTTSPMELNTDPNPERPTDPSDPSGIFS